MKKVIAIDFDGTLCKNKYPEIGNSNEYLINSLIDIQKRDKAYLILYTCRTGELLQKAIDWCSNQGLIFDAVNENLECVIEKFGGDTRKIYADIYIDDKTMCLGYESMDYSDDPEDIWFVKSYYERCIINQIETILEMN